jgi:hypothetical protein
MAHAKIAAASLPIHVTTHTRVAVYVGLAEPPNGAVTQLETRRGVSCVWLDWAAIPKSSFANAFIGTWRRALGWSDGTDVPMGYYLFLDGSPRAYHPGLVDPGDETQWWALGIGVAAVLSKSKQVGQLAYDVLFSRASARVAAHFEAVLADYERGGGTGHAPAAVAEDELPRAYRILGLVPGATHAEVKARYRELAKQNHPDRCAGDADALRDANNRMAQINTAYELVLARLKVSVA